MITRATYWDHPGVSQSQLKELDVTPFHYWSKYVAKTTPDVDKSHLRKGNALHAALFEPDGYAARFPVFEGEARTNEAKARKAAMESAVLDLDGAVLRESEADDVTSMTCALKAHPAARAVLATVHASELPIAFPCPTTGIECKARIDALAMDGDLLIDLKTTRGAGREPFSKAIVNYGYHLQAAQYLAAVEAHTGKRPSDYVILAVENVAPYAVATYRLPPHVIAKGEQMRLRLLDKLAECRASNRWPGYSDRIEDIDLPSWAA